MEQFDSIEDAQMYFERQFDDGTFSISIVDAADGQATTDAYRRHFVCCGYGDEEILIQGEPYVAIFDYGH